MCAWQSMITVPSASFGAALAGFSQAATTPAPAACRKLRRVQTDRSCIRVILDGSRRQTERAIRPVYRTIAAKARFYVGQTDDLKQRTVGCVRVFGIHSDSGRR